MQREIILAVDDRQDNLTSIKAILKNNEPEIEVITALSGMEGLDKASRYKPDAIILDVNMPVMDGYDVVRALKNQIETRSIPIIMLTAKHLNSASRVKGLELGADVFLTKPISEDELVAQIRVMLRIKRAEDELRKEKEQLRKISERRKSDLINSESKYLAFFNNSITGIVLSTMNGVILDANEAFVNLLELNADNLSAYKVGDVYKNPQDRLKFIDILNNKGKIEGFETQFKSQNGTILWVAIHTRMIELDDSLVLCSTVVDISERKRIEEELISKEKYYRSLLHSIQEDIIVIDRDYNITDINNSALKSSRLTPGQIKDKKCYEILHHLSEPCDKYNELCFITDVFNTGEVRHFEHIHLNENNQQVHMDILLSPLIDDNGQVNKVIESSRDITELKKAHYALEASEHKYQSLVDNAFDGIYLIENQQFTYVNPQFLKMTGYSDTELFDPDFKILKLFAEPHQDIINKTFDRSDKRKSKISDQLESAIIRKDGKIIQVELSTTDIGQGENIAVLGIMRDISERKKNEQKLTFQANILKNISDAIIATDLNFIVTRWNKGAELMYGFTMDEALNMNLNALIKPDYKDKTIKEIYDKIRQNGEFQGELLHHKKDGSAFYTWSTESTINDENNKPVGFVYVNRDLTQIKENENKLKQERKRAQLYLDIAGVIIIALDKQSNVMMINQKGEQILGYTKEEIIGKNWLDTFLLPQNKKEIEDYFKELVEGKQNIIVYNENYIINSEGERLLIGWNNSLLYDEKGEIIGTLSSGEDITERTRASQALINSEKRFRMFYENSPLGYHSLNPEAKIKDVNPSWLDILGYERHEVIGKPLTDFIVKDQKKLFKQNFERFKKKGISRDIQYNMIRGNGEVISIQIDTNGQYDSNFNFIRSHTIMQDITEKKKAELALVESEKRFRSIIEDTEAGYFFIDDKGIIKNVNQSWVNLYKYDSVEDVIGKPYEDTQVEDDLAKSREIVKGILLGDPNFLSGEFSRKCMDGSVGYHTFSAKPVIHKGKRIGFEGFIIDTTERKRTQAKLQESEEFLKSIYQGSSTGIYVIDIIGKSDLKFAGINKTFEKILNIDSDLIIGKRPDDLKPHFSDDIINNNINLYQRALETKEIVIAESTYILNDEETWWLNIITPLMVENRVYRLIGNIINITERKKAEINLKKWEYVFENAEWGIALSRPEKEFIELLNPALAKMHGYSIKEFLNIPYKSLFPEYEHDRMSVNHELAVINGHNAYECDHIRKDGSIFKVFIDLTVIDDPFSGNKYIIINVQDITEKKKNENARLAAERKQTELVKIAEESAKLASIGVMAAGITHEINQPLNAIRLGADTLELWSQQNPNILPNFTTDILKRISQGATRISLIVDHMRNYWIKPEEDVSKCFDLNDTINRALGLIGSQVRNHEISLDLSLMDSALQIKGNPLQMEQIVNNLITNSIHALDETEQKLKRIVLRTNLNEDKAILEVSDNGTGFDIDNTEDLFDPFFSSKDPTKGMGLGLAIVKMFVDRFNGSISAENNKDKGALFRVILPLYKISNGE